MKIKPLSRKLDSKDIPIKLDKPLKVNRKLNPYRVSRGRGIK